MWYAGMLEGFLENGDLNQNNDVLVLKVTV